MNQADAELTALFDEAAQTPLDTEFVLATLSKIHRAQRRRQTFQVLALVPILAVAALIAPEVARLSLMAAPLGYVCAILIAWRTARRLAT